jgi:2-methylaconitate cis-trans-isomerase PrpF
MQQNGVIREASEIDLLARIMSMGRMHRAFALTGGICTTIAAGIAGTLVHDVVSDRARASGNVRLGHPSGVLALEARMYKDGESWHVEKVSAARTARRLMEGYIYVPERLLGESEQGRAGARPQGVMNYGPYNTFTRS